MSLAADLVALLQQLLPETCPRCGQIAERGFCADCVCDFVRVRSPCPCCGLPRPCTRCPAHAPGWHANRVIAPFAYAPPLAGFVQALKYSRRRALGRALGELLAGEVIRCDGSGDVLVPVPLHPRRLRERRFNQADEIARPLARRLKIPLLPALVRRRHASAPQAALDRGERWRSVQNAFSVHGRVDGAHAVVVDDVMTTGATVNAIAEQLKRAGADRVSVWAVTRSIDNADRADQPARKM